MKKCVIRFDENSEHYLSTQYEKADFKIFTNKSLAKVEIKLM